MNHRHLVFNESKKFNHSGVRIKLTFILKQRDIKWRLFVRYCYVNMFVSLLKYKVNIEKNWNHRKSEFNLLNMNKKVRVSGYARGGHWTLWSPVTHRADVTSADSVTHWARFHARYPHCPFSALSTLFFYTAFCNRLYSYVTLSANKAVLYRAFKPPRLLWWWWLLDYI